jgi:hypothetical protein
MRNTLRLLLITLLTGLLLCSYSYAAMKKTQKPMPTSKGAEHKMKTYYMGRFAIDLPEDFKLEIQSQTVRYAEVSDFKWKEKDRDKERNALWAQKIEKIKKLTPPKIRKQIIIEEKVLKGIGHEARAIAYYGNQYAPNCTYWTILADYGTVGMWLTLDGEDDGLSIKNFTNILKHYQYGFNDLTKDSFCLNYGRIELPYLEQESTYARFAGPMGMKLEIEMRQIHKEPESGGIISRTIAAMATGFASGLDIEKVRSRKKTAANLPGEEEILQGSDGENQDLSFDWEYLGTVESGEKPWIQITLDTKPDNRDEKIIIWDQILNSFRPAYKR